MDVPTDTIEAVPPAYTKDWALALSGALLPADLKQMRSEREARRSSCKSPPAYSATSQLTAQEVLELAIADAGHYVSLEKHPYFIPFEQRHNPGPKQLYRQLNNEEAEKPIALICYDRSINAAGSTQDLFLRAFFTAISEGAADLVSQAIDSGLVDANTPATGLDAGLTPLLCAVQYRQTRLVPLLISKGARVDDFGIYRSWSDMTAYPATFYHHAVLNSGVRTPLQLAASLGNLVVVKILLEQYSADDSLVAPDGQIALRLAAQNGHTEVVTFLPVRRGGGYLRWKKKHHKFVERIRKGGKSLYRIGKLVVYDIPHFIVTLFGSCVKAGVLKAWKQRRKVLLWCMNLPRRCWRVLIETPEALKDIIVALTRFTIKIITVYVPALAKLLWRAVVVTGKATWGAAAWILNRLASLIHTLLSAIVSAFRWMTLQNIANGCKDLLHAVFVTLPKALLVALEKIGRLIWHLPSSLVDLVSIIIMLACGLVTAITKPIWKILSGIGGTIGEGFKEIHLWFNPKG